MANLMNPPRTVDSSGHLYRVERHIGRSQTVTWTTIAAVAA
jgi:hypothetical protein